MSISTLSALLPASGLGNKITPHPHFAVKPLLALGTIFTLMLLGSALQASTAIVSDPGGGGGVGGNAASSPGPSYPWVGSVDDTSTATGNKLTTVPTVGWTVRGGLRVDLTLYHNSETTLGAGSRGAKWSLFYDSNVKSDASGNVRVAWGNGLVYTFGNNGNGAYLDPPGIHDRLVMNGSPASSYDIVMKDQVKYHFAPYGSGGIFYLTTIADENGNSITVNRASNGGTLGVSDSTGRSAKFGFTGSYYTSITDPLNHVVSFGFDGSGNMSSVTYPILNGASYGITLGYDANHNVTSYKDQRGNTETFSYNSADNSLAWAQTAAGNRTTFQYGIGFGGGVNASATSIIDPNGRRTVHTYTTIGQLASIIDPTGYTEYYTYDGGNNVTQKQDRRGYLWNSTYDGMGNVLTAADPYSNTTRFTYNGHSKPLTVSLPLGRSTAYTYDTSDNLTQVQQKDAGGAVTATTTCTIGSYGLASDKYDPNNHHTAYTYDGNGYLSSVTTPLGHQTQWAYDALGFRTSRRDAMLRTTSYTPDAWERLVQTTYPDGSTNTYGYDPSGNLTAFANYAAAWTRTYDADDRMTYEYVGGGTRTVSHSYDAPGQRGLLSSVTDFDGRVITYAYSARNELASVAEAAGTTTYAYDANGNQTNLYLPNGLRTDQYYDYGNTLSGYYNWDGAGNIWQSYGYSTNADHQTVGMSEGTSSDVNARPNPTLTNYGYDGQGHLTSESRNGPNANSQSYSYDGAGNRTSVNGGNPFTYDADDELTNVGGVNAFALTYNANGDRVTETINGQLTTFTYDFDDRLTGITAGGTSTSYSYDALGRQVSRSVNGQLTGYYLDGDQMLLEKQGGGGANLAVYTWGNGLIRCNGEYPLTDGRGNVRLTTDGSRNVTSSNAPDAYGVASYTANTASAYLWNGGAGYRTENLAPLGLPLNYSFQKVGARYYDPTLACFLTRDTELGEKPYAYCDGDPVNFSDPTGHKKAWWQSAWNALKGLFGGNAPSISYNGPSRTTTTTTTTYSNQDTWTNGRGGGQQLHQTVTKTTTTTTRSGPTLKADL